jgi:hypothetical protein
MRRKSGCTYRGTVPKAAHHVYQGVKSISAPDLHIAYIITVQKGRTMSWQGASGAAPCRPLSEATQHASQHARPQAAHKNPPFVKTERQIQPRHVCCSCGAPATIKANSSARTPGSKWVLLHSQHPPAASSSLSGEQKSSRQRQPRRVLRPWPWGLPSSWLAPSWQQAS